MTCKEANEKLYEYLDNELDKSDYSKIKKHLDMCQKCCEKFEFEQTLKKIIRDRTRTYKMSQTVRENIVQQLSEMREERTRIERQTVKPEAGSKISIFQLFALHPSYVITVALIPFIICGFSVYFVFFKSSNSPPIVREAAECHDRLVNGEMFLDLVSSDRNEMRKHFEDSKHIGFAVVVPVLNGYEVKLLGCKDCYLAGRKSAHIELERKRNKISLEMIDGSGMNINNLKKELFDGRAYHFGRHKGYNVVLWRYGNTLYSLTSEVQRKELIRVADEAIRSRSDRVPRVFMPVSE